MTGLYEKVNQFVLDTPIYQREVIKRLAVYQLHGILTPPRIAPSCPHLLRRITGQSPVSTLDFMAGQEYHYPYFRLSPYREPPGTSQPQFLAPCRNSQTQVKIIK